MPRLLTEEELNNTLTKMCNAVDNQHAEGILTNVLVTMGYAKLVKYYYDVSVNEMKKLIKEELINERLKSNDD